MANVTNGPAMNAPVWNDSTTISNEVLTGGFDQITVAGYYLIISNIGASNVWVGPNDAAQGILLQPGATFETAIAAASDLYVIGTAAQPITVVQYA